MSVRPLLFGAVVCALSLTACGSQSGDGSSPTMTAGTSGVQVELGNTITYGSVGTTAEIDCADGKSLNVAGNNNTLTVKGACAAVTVTGADNRIALDRIDKDLAVVGLNNTVKYRDGDPSVSDTGSGNKVTKG